MLLLTRRPWVEVVAIILATCSVLQVDRITAHRQPPTDGNHSIVVATQNILQQPPILLIPDENNQPQLFANSFYKLSSEFDHLPRTGKHRLVTDVGLELGTSLRCLVGKDPSLVLMGLEIHPVNFGVSYANTWRVSKRVRSSILNRLIILPLGASNESATLVFNENDNAACGSILPSGPDNQWHCSTSSRKIYVPVVRLDVLFDLIPPEYSFYFLKIDAEGADLLVLQGAGKYLSRHQMVAVECRLHPDRTGGCNRETLLTFMAQQQFTHSECSRGDCYFGKSELLLEKAKRWQKAAAVFDKNNQDCKSTLEMIAREADPKHRNQTAGLNMTAQGKSSSHQKRLSLRTRNRRSPRQH